jgi:hypothetical protein
MNQFGHHIQSNAGLVGNSYQRRAKRKRNEFGNRYAPPREKKANVLAGTALEPKPMLVGMQP